MINLAVELRSTEKNKINDMRKTLYKEKVSRNIFLVNDNCVLREKKKKTWMFCFVCFFKIYCNSFSKRSYCEEFKCGEPKVYLNLFKTAEIIVENLLSQVINYIGENLLCLRILAEISEEIFWKSFAVSKWCWITFLYA